MRRTFPAGVTILKADWPYQVSCVSMLVTKPKTFVRARPVLLFNGLTIQRGEAIRHSAFAILIEGQ
jgi:hypothetical protein